MKVLALSSHPIQYLAPLYRELARSGDVDLHVVFLSNASVKGTVDPGFGRSVAWDTPLLEGYASSFSLASHGLEQPRRFGLGHAVPAIARHQPDVVLLSGYLYGFELESLAACRLRGVPVVMRGEFGEAQWTSGRLRRLVRAPLVRGLYRQVRSFGVIGEAARRHLLAHGVDARRLFPSPYFVDWENLSQGAEARTRAELRRDLGVPEDARVVLASGKFIERKAVDVLLDAVATGRSSVTDVLLVGSGPEEAALRQRASALPPEVRVHFAGFVNQSGLHRYFRAADAFVLPSRFETWGLVVNEALHFGLPVVVSDRAGCRHDLVRPDVGRTFRSEDPASLATALAETLALAARPETRQRCLDLIAPYSARAAGVGLLRAIRFAVEGGRTSH